MDELARFVFYNKTFATFTTFVYFNALNTRLYRCCTCVKNVVLKKSASNNFKYGSIEMFLTFSGNSDIIYQKDLK